MTLSHFHLALISRVSQNSLAHLVTSSGSGNKQSDYNFQCILTSYWNTLPTSFPSSRRLSVLNVLYGLLAQVSRPSGGVQTSGGGFCQHRAGPNFLLDADDGAGAEAVPAVENLANLHCLLA